MKIKFNYRFWMWAWACLVTLLAVIAAIEWNEHQEDFQQLEERVETLEIQTIE